MLHAGSPCLEAQGRLAPEQSREGGAETLSGSSEWPAELDAVIAAPQFHRLLLENEHVRVLDTRIEPGQTVPVHTHRWPSVYHILSWSDFVRRDAAGQVLVDTRESPGSDPPVALWAHPLPPHSLENVGTKAIHLVSVELKGGPAV
jgi:hypothetical protein